MAPTAVADRRIRRKAKKNSNLANMSDNIETSSGAETPEVVDEQEFENDLDYLLTNKEKTEGELVYTSTEENKSNEIVIQDSFQDKALNKKKQNGQLTSKKPKKFTVADITKDMEDLDFSSDEDEDHQNVKKEDKSDPKAADKKTKNKLNKKKSERSINKSKSDSRKKNELRKSKSTGNIKPKVDTRDIKKDLIDTSLEGKDVAKAAEQKHQKPEKNKKSKKPKSNKKTKPTNTKNENETKSEEDKGNSSPNSPTPEVSQDLDESEPGDVTIDNDNEQPEETEEEILRRKLKNKKRKDRRKKRAALLKEGAADTQEVEAADTTNDHSKESTPEVSPEVDNSNPFSIKLRSVKSTTNKKYSENLPEVQPIKTIIGMSHQQILHSDLSDVKIKTLMTSSSISKYAANSVKFVTTHAEDLFGDFEKKKIFLTLCINVALYESLGFKKTVKIYPNVLELFGGYDEINLEKTRTKLTPSKKDIHQNNLDYSVLSYFGHILIWAAHQQRQGKVPIFTEKFDITLTNNEVRSKLGGYHLWDKLFRELKGMNSKRWKHVIKFRNAFQYEEDQFMIILRFMSIDDNIP